MKPAWDQLGDEYADSPSVLIGDVDCTASGESLCQKVGVQGYPTIKYYVDGDTEGKDYQGGRDSDSLKKHVEDNMEVKCIVGEPADCTDKEKGYIEKMKGKTAEDRAKQLKRLDGMKGDSMKPELKQWLNQRLRILQQMSGGDEL
uniref:Thioredoxin domain-containing protein n=1 Tax=Odontella aurita TaxID=265563 RepID=A0A7S4J3S0_9STRA|mmetsp:Transcript_37301/g.111722  ORF Transcript_37301/g.111722 Transcript_37301/m.111722 type:complete len:145 (+) Transcript_37301:199-633(+)